MFVNCSLGGQNFGAPDTCLTPAAAGAPVPIPYPNTAMLSMAIPNQFKVMISMMPAHNLCTTIPMSSGDEAGVMLGVTSGTIMGPSRHLKGSIKVFYDGMPATRLTDTAMQNSTNVPGGMTVAPSQTKVMALS